MTDRTDETAEESARSDLRASTADGIAFGLMVGCGETYLQAFVLAVGLGEVFSGLVSSVPLLAGGLMQLVSPAAVRRLGSYRRWVVICAGLQALAFVPLVVAALLGRIAPWLAMLVSTVYWGTGLATGPAWNTWIGTLVPRPIRAGFFARRTRYSQAAVLVGFLAAGVALQRGRGAGHELHVFAGMFVAATACRLVSVAFLAAHREPDPPSREPGPPLLRELLRGVGPQAGGRLLVYLVAVQGFVQFSGPYFSPFMLKELRVSYGEFVGLIAVSFVAKVVFLPIWGRVTHRSGAMRLLWIGGLGIVPLPAMWTVSQDLLWVGLVQLFGGIVWAAYELAFFLLFFESIPEAERTRVLTLYNLADKLAWVAGSLLGALLLRGLGTTREAYLLLFVLSSTGRVLTLLLLRRVGPLDVPAAEIGVRTLDLRPSEASFDAPVLPSLPDQTDEVPPPAAT